MLCLDGIVVLDLTRRYPGAYASMFLGDFGADVIKIDPPGVNPLTALRAVPEERFAAFNAYDRNKRSIVLDLKNDGAREVFLRLAAKADVLIEGYRPGVMDRLGLGYPRLSALNPRLVFCSLSGFGQSGPYANTPAHDMNYLALGGALSLIGERNGRPYLPANLVADLAGAGLHGVIGVLLALMARTKTGKGQFVDVSYLDSVISLLSGIFSDYFQSGIVPKRGQTSSTGAAPWAQVYRCADGEYFTVGAVEPHLWANLCRALDRADLIPYQKVTGERAEQVVAELAAVFATRTRDEWFALLKDKEAGVGPVYTVDETATDPQVIHREMIVDHAHAAIGNVRQVGVPIKLSETPGSIRRLGVPTGSDADALLEELGYSEARIAELRASGALG